MKSENENNPPEADIVVIGAGGAGLAAAVAAAEKGVSVLVMEKERKAGGATPFAEGIVAAESPTQKRANIQITRDQLFRNHMDYTHWTLNARLVRALIDKSSDTVAWLENMGLSFTLRGLHGSNAPDRPNNQMANLMPPVFHIPPEWGTGIIKVLLKKCNELGVRFLYRTRVEKLLTDKTGAVSGVVVTSEGDKRTIYARSAIIATGGYSSSKELMRKYCPQYDVNNIDKLNVKGTHPGDRIRWLRQMHTGDGILMAFEIGAADEGLGNLLMNGPNFVAGNHAWMLAMNAGAIRVNTDGERFAAENLGPFVSDNTTIRQPGQVMFSIFDNAFKDNIVKNGFGPISGGKYPHEASGIEKDLAEAVARGSCHVSDSWDDIAGWMGAPPQKLKATITEYNSFCEKGHDDSFAKDAMFLKAIKTPPYYACRSYPGFLVTIGGIRVNHRMEVLKKDNTPIPCLYAAGITTGGWSGTTYNIGLPGAGCGFPVYGGRIAGENAVESIKNLQD
ncbi:MAG: FAD-dependent oxidoreductase [Dehalococcoidales bacterium]|nr:FAD-dependent oxidoreductase [Dehalococcoidales bacterium]